MTGFHIVQFSLTDVWADCKETVLVKYMWNLVYVYSVVFFFTINTIFVE